MRRARRRDRRRYSRHAHRDSSRLAEIRGWVELVLLLPRLHLRLDILEPVRLHEEVRLNEVLTRNVPRAGASFMEDVNLAGDVGLYEPCTADTILWSRI